VKRHVVPQGVPDQNILQKSMADLTLTLSTVFISTSLLILKRLGDFVNFKISRFRLSDVLDMMCVCINKSECSFVLCMISIVLLKFGPRLHDA
jgi:hypothetical protein